jgi:3-deoxy-D-manno-octulosonate 8-phosphate phosphatase (KDO 8-P phosphatase)
MVTNPYTEYPQALDRATKVKLLVLDVDGVLTDGSLLIGQDGKEAFKIFDSLDGHGIKLLQSTGVIVAIITGRNSSMVEGRAKELGIKHVQMGVSEKFKALQILLEQTKLTLSDCAVIGATKGSFFSLPRSSA